MRAIGRTALLALGFAAPWIPLTVQGVTINVATDAAVTASYPTFGQSAGPFPWSDFGITASASITPGTLVAAVGGSTSYAFDTGLSGGQVFTPGSTTLDLGYTPAWTGFVLTSAAGTLNSDLVYNVGPFNGSTPIFNGNPGTHAGTNLTSVLNLGGVAVSSNSASTGLGGISGTLAATAGPCPACVTVASVTVGVSVGAKLTQTVSVSPTATYGDLLWYSKAPSYSAADDPVFVPGSGGGVQNLFATPPASLGLTSGDTFYLNLLPAVQLTMPVGDAADLAAPATFNISGQIFGSGFDLIHSLGNLYDLQTGTETFSFDGTWSGGQFYSVPLEFTSLCNDFGCVDSYAIPGGGGLGTGDVGIPSDLVPPGTFTGGSWPGFFGGPGTTNMGPLFPNGACPPGAAPGSAGCITQVSFTPTAPEPGSLALLIPGLLGIAAAGFHHGSRRTRRSA